MLRGNGEGSTMKEREDVVAAVLAAAGGELTGRVRLQKAVYLMDRLGLESGFSFDYHHYGPFSRDLDNATADAKAFGLVEEEFERRQSDGATYSIFRLKGQPKPEAYGRLGVLANWRTEPKILFDISPAAFVPQPKVTSSVVRLVPRVAPEPCDRKALEMVAAAAFGQRRKMLRQSLKSLPVDPTRLAQAADVDLTRRAETIPVSGFVAMARELTNIRNGKS